MGVGESRKAKYGHVGVRVEHFEGMCGEYRAGRDLDGFYLIGG